MLRAFSRRRETQRRASHRLVLASLAWILSTTPIATLATPQDRLELLPGAVVEDFELRDLDGTPHRLSSYRDHKTIVLAFNGVGCPIAELYAPRLRKIHERFDERGVAILGINASPADTVPELRGFQNAFELGFPILKDHEQAVADALGVERTTEVLVLDGSLTLRYRGSVDDQYAIGKRSVGLRKDRPETHYLVQAIESVLRGEKPPVEKTEALGCVITRLQKPSKNSELTYHRDIEPIVQRRCQSCHRENAIGPFPLLRYEDVEGWAGMIEEVVENRRMPPWHAHPRHAGQFSNDRSLTDTEREAILTWIDDGAPRGDPAEAPPPRTFPEGWTIGEPDAVFEMSPPFTVPADGTIPYQFRMVRTSFSEDRWVKASEIRAGSPSVVHHILVFAVDPEDPKRWRRETGLGVKGYFAIMVPGERPTVYPDGMAKRLPAGATLVFQIHYTASGRKTEDVSKVGFVFADDPVEHEVHTRSAHNVHGLYIPPRAKQHEISASYRFRQPSRILSFLPHMHLRGEKFRYELLLPATVKVSRTPDWAQLPDICSERLRFDRSSRELTWTGAMPQEVHQALQDFYDDPADLEAIDELASRGRTRLLLDVPLYDFGWQNTYRLAEPLDVPREAVLFCTATYNNSPFNPALTRDQYSEAVRWGEQTWEEMLIGYFDFVRLDEPSRF